ncbi:helix-turn-helix domain-containing protein [Reichenbachiella sp.]|uniref:helix-turn-helix domain-containing protein n=1 Tax=Reichenbachiella sp. TaxID=2184521 RepID=UPI003B5BA68F
MKTTQKNLLVVLWIGFMMLHSTAVAQNVEAPSAPSFDTWTSLFLFVSLQALFVFIALFNLKGAQSQANKILGFLLLTFAVILFSYVLYWTHYNRQFPYLNGWYHPLLLISGVLFFLYVRIITTGQPLKKSDWLHFLFPIGIMLCLMPIYINNFQGGDRNNMVNPTVRPFLIIGFNAYLKVVYMGTYLFFAFRLYYQANLKDSYLKPWFNYLLISYSGYYLTIVLYYALVNFSFFDVTWDYMISFAMSFFIFCVSFLGYIYPQVLAGKPVSNILLRHKYQNSGLTERGELELKEKLLSLMVEDELFLNNDLNLNQLALKANTTRHNVSLVINKYFNQNFFDFINAYRIKYVQALFLKPECQGEHVIQLAYRAGFNNKVSFNKAFKKFTGQTPLSYKSDRVK